MDAQKGIVGFLTSLSSDQLRVAELMAGCYDCPVFNSCKAGQEFVAKPKAAAEFVQDHAPRSSI